MLDLRVFVYSFHVLRVSVSEWVSEWVNEWDWIGPVWLHQSTKTKKEIYLKMRESFNRIIFHEYHSSEWISFFLFLLFFSISIEHSHWIGSHSLTVQSFAFRNFVQVKIKLANSIFGLWLSRNNKPAENDDGRRKEKSIYNRERS